MATLNPMPTVHAGHTILLKINGTVIGRASGVDDVHDFTQDQIYEIGSIMPQENVVTQYRGTLTIDKFFIQKNSLADAGYVGLGEKVLTSGLLTIEVQNNLDGSAVRTYEGCVCTNYSANFRANQIAGERASFVFLNAV